MKLFERVIEKQIRKHLEDNGFLASISQVKIEGFLSPKVYPKAGVSQGSNLSPLFFLIYANDMPNPIHHQTNKSQFADDTGQWAMSKKHRFSSGISAEGS